MTNRRLERRPYVERLRNNLLTQIVEFAGISGDPETFGTDAYHFLDKPHRFIRDLIEERDRLAKELTATREASKEPTRAKESCAVCGGVSGCGAFTICAACVPKHGPYCI